MLIIAERVLWVFTVCGILLFGGVYAIFGGPSMTPAIEQQAKKVGEKEFNLTKSEKAELDRQAAAGVQDSDTDSKKKTKRPKKIDKYVANQQMYEAVNNPTRARAELEKVKSDVIMHDGKPALKIYDFDSTAIVGKLGFKENDIITTVAGQQLDFESLKGMDFGTISAGSEAYGLYNQFREQAESGAPISVDVVRNGSPMQILIRFEDLK